MYVILCVFVVFVLVFEMFRIRWVVRDMVLCLRGLFGISTVVVRKFILGVWNLERRLWTRLYDLRLRSVDSFFDL